MSGKYADGLSDFPDKGKCGLPEKFDSDLEIEAKCLELSEWIRQAKGKVAVHTGAGISTSSGIPDFRGPRGIWTLEKKKEKPVFSVAFEDAKPTLTHMALVGLERAGFINAVITQNVDGLHLRSGYPRNRIAILHGDMFLEECDLCHTLYQLDVPAKTVGLKRSGERCIMSRRLGRGRCRGYIRDTILDWEDQLPYEDLEFAQQYSKEAELSICLGTTLQIVPGGDLPLLTKKKKTSGNKGCTSDGRLAIVNLQPTKRDRNADMKIHGYVDRIMKLVCKHLNVTIPDFTRPTLVLESRHSLPGERRRWTVISSEMFMNPTECPSLETKIKRKSDTNDSLESEAKKIKPSAHLYSPAFKTDDFSSLHRDEAKVTVKYISELIKQEDDAIARQYENDVKSDMHENRLNPSTETSDICRIELAKLEDN